MKLTDIECILIDNLELVIQLSETDYVLEQRAEKLKRKLWLYKFGLWETGHIIFG